ncbi:MAG: N-acetyl-D-glucosamine kinase [Cytophagales bacterium]|jgi:predicted NBD/HSP70 family sugar kinase|nr:ROK family protein [Bacteroidota bacterium]MBS1979649.1 ROK family protein [Bacteroidota bacterium]WHZ09150.1 MAG: N-acetyl-D-glucosamine kinase [Cytophagales bacterium]
MKNTEHLWGIDLGGTKAEGIVLQSADDPKVLFRDRLPTEAFKGYDHVLHQIKGVTDKMEQAMGYRKPHIGIATPGVRDPKTHLMHNSNSTCLNGRPLKEDLEQLLGTKLSMANDANCFALAEATMGVVKEKFPEAQVVFGVILGTGVGGGLVVNGKIINGLHGIGGEWGHNFLDESGGGPCYCGKMGCVENVLSGPALEKFYTSLNGTKKPMKEIYADYNLLRDEYSQKTINRLIHFFGLALSVVINIVDPDVVVIGGGVGNIDLIYTEGAKSLTNFIFNDRCETPIVKPKLGDSAGVFGAAYLTAN